MEGYLSNEYNDKIIRSLQQNLIYAYAQSSIFNTKDSKGIFQSCVTFGSNCPSIQIPYSEDYLYRVLYYFILYYSFESGQSQASYLIDSLTKMIVKYQGNFEIPPSLKTSKIKLSIQQIRGLYFSFLHQLRNSIKHEKLLRILNGKIYIDYMFMNIMHTLILHYKQLGIFLQQLGIQIHIFKQLQILLDNFQIKLNKNKISQYIAFRIQKQNLYQDLISNKNIQLCQSIVGTIQESLINSQQQQQQQSQNKNYYGFLGTARHVKSFYDSKVYSNKLEYSSSILNYSNQVSLQQITQVIESLQLIQSPSKIFNKKQNNNKIKNAQQKQLQYNLNQQVKTVKTVKKQKNLNLQNNLNQNTNSIKKSLDKQFQFVRTINQIYIPTNIKSQQQIISKNKNNIKNIKKTSIQKFNFNNKIEHQVDIQVSLLSTRITRIKSQIPQHLHNYHTPSCKIKLIKDFFKKTKMDPDDS